MQRVHGAEMVRILEEGPNGRQSAHMGFTLRCDPNGTRLVLKRMGCDKDAEGDYGEKTGKLR